ncbi:MAG: hypothetical protein HC824_15805 [Synechococcales cyanobacterium RM1_1_8]|nr:hypothetical protein [Synechococcales cyanobacterium RM1_1_8]
MAQTPAILTDTVQTENNANQLMAQGIPTQHAIDLSEAIAAHRASGRRPSRKVKALVKTYGQGIRQAIVLPRGFAR